MADTKTSGLTSYTTPLDADVLPIVDTANNTTKKITWASIKAALSGALACYQINPGMSVTTPADATTYYGGNNFWAASTTTAGVVRYYIPRGGTIKRCYLFVRNRGTLGTSEVSTISIRQNNTTDTVITAALTTNATGAAFSNTALSIAVSAGDYIELKWVTPTWVTNPTSVDINAVIFIE